jgi:hypothetical protein
MTKGGRVSESASLIQRVAAAVGCAVETVEQVLNDYGLNLASPARRHRSLRVDRLRVRGSKGGSIEPGDFDETFSFNLGVTVIAADNFRGKTTILEILTLVLRGERRDLQADVLSWLTGLALDVHINGQPIGFRLSLKDSEISEGRILAGTVSDLASSDDAAAAGVTELSWAQGNDGWAEQVGSFMMTQLGLDEIQVFNRARNDDEAGTIKSHGWPAYYSVIYPPAAADRVLLGSTAGDFLPVRLMQVFLDMPDATRSMRIGALAKRLDSEFKADQRRGRDTSAALERQLAAARERLISAETSLRETQDQVPAATMQELMQLAADTGARLTEARQTAEASAAAFKEAQAARVSDEKALNALRESAAASAFFHGLDPQSCPRCETAISSQRKLQEHDTHQCAVCHTAYAEDDGDDDLGELEQQTNEALAASRAAEKALDAARSRAESQLTQAQQELNEIDLRISQVLAIRQATERVGAEHELAAATAVVQTLEGMVPAAAQPSTAQKVLAAIDEMLREDIGQASRELYADLSNAARDLAVSFGIRELESVKVKANGHMDVTKGGGAKSGFGEQSPGERLRLRYALIVALLRTARTRSIAGHPGLLLLDSLKAEEVQDDHARVLLQGLITAAKDEPGLQILVTTADQQLAGEVSGVAATIAPRADRSSLF